MSHAKGRKARDDRYYQANKDEINRRRRERRLRERQKQAPGSRMLKLVENPLVGALGVSDQGQPSDQQPASDQTQTPNQETASDQGLASDQPASDDYPASSHGWASGQTQPSNRRPASDQTQASDQVQASDQAQVSDQHGLFSWQQAYQSWNHKTSLRNESEESIMLQTSAPFATVYSFPIQGKKSGGWEVIKAIAKWCPAPLNLFQLLVVLGLALLSTFLQYEFYSKHDVLPGYAGPLAIAGSLAMVALLTLKLKGTAHWVRQLVCGGYYLFMIASTSFHVFSHTWEQVAIEAIPSSLPEPAKPAGLDPVTQALTGALQKATKDGAWSTMRDIAGKLPKPTVTTVQTPRPNPFGISRESVTWTGAAILIVLRALLEAAQALCVVALKRQIPDMTGKVN